jgi:hypothetical protein
MEKLPKEIFLRGRRFSQEELQMILAVTAQMWHAGRTRISEEVCRRLPWTQENGWLKDRACRDVLRKLEALGYLSLPPSTTSAGSRPYTHWLSAENTSAVAPPITGLIGRLQLDLAKGDATEKTWNGIVRASHYMGFKVAVGRCLKFLVRDDQNLLAAISLSEAAWAVESRDKILAFLGVARNEVANNSRFLILPHVRIPNLASRILSLLSTKCAPAWEAYYGRRLLVLETFVDHNRFKGTSYRAANWLMVGATRGYRKSGSAHHNSQTVKSVFLYPLLTKHRIQLVSRTNTASGGVAA